MRDWNLSESDPLALTLAADARCGPTNYLDDQIWELSIRRGDPPAVSMETTYGLRARSMRLFPVFSLTDADIVDPHTFHRPVAVHQFFPNYLRLDFEPFPQLDVQMEYWVPNSHSIAGRCGILNKSDQSVDLKFHLTALLFPNDGARMAPSQVNSTSVLVGSTTNLYIVLFMAGSQQIVSSPFPAYVSDLQLSPGARQQLIWCQAARIDIKESFELARDTCARKWEAEIARLEQINNDHLIEIYTGEKDWDAAFAFSQKIAYQSLVGPTDSLPSCSSVLSRNPDDGYSITGDGTDYGAKWSGQSPFIVKYLLEFLLPGAPDLAWGLLDNYFTTQQPNGNIDLSPGLAGQRRKLLAPPIIAHLAWQIYQTSNNLDDLRRVYHPLREFLSCWLQEDHDRDQDGVPEWKHPQQFFADENQLFSRWQVGGKGIDPSKLESPIMCAFLGREYEALAAIAAELHLIFDSTGYKTKRQEIADALNNGWDPMKECYDHWDYATHHSHNSIRIINGSGNGKFNIDRDFDSPIRLQLTFYLVGNSRPLPDVYIKGVDSNGQHHLERVSGNQFRRYINTLYHTGAYLYQHIDQIEIRGLQETDRFEIESMGTESDDLTNLLPLSARLVPDERAKRIIATSIQKTGSFFQPYGLSYYQESNTVRSDNQNLMILPLVADIILGLVTYGYNSEAAEIFTRIMNTIVVNLKQEQGFRQFYDPATGAASGERNAITGLVPIRTFLATIGVLILDENRVIVFGRNPYPWPVTVKYHGTTIMAQAEKSVIVFQNGHTCESPGIEPQFISLQPV